jgi:hypothetical protein
MEWITEFCPECYTWFKNLAQPLQDEIRATLSILEMLCPQLGRPKVDSIHGSSISNLKELRIQFKGDPWRILFAFDPKRHAILLVGGNKANDKRWYEKFIPIAELRYTQHLEKIEKK